MNKKIFIIIFTSAIVLNTYSQEFKCNVQFVSQQIQGTNKQVFKHCKMLHLSL
jgi:hypothetical protein